jgi:hypothetical protein
MKIKLGSFEFEMDDMYVPAVLGMIVIIVALVVKYK